VRGAEEEKEERRKVIGACLLYFTPERGHVPSIRDTITPRVGTKEKGVTGRKGLLPPSHGGGGKGGTP